MGKYRKKPVIVEAVKNITDTSFEEEKCPSWLCEAYKNGKIFKEGRELFIKTLEGNMKVSNGDYIIKGIQGEFYACKADIFHETYEEVI